MKISELHPRMPVTVGKSESLESACKLLADEDIGALVVYEPNGLAGIVSERDVVRAVGDGCDLSETEVCEYMTVAPVVAEEDAVIGDAIAKMNESGIRHVVIVSKGDVSGMISMRDLFVSVGCGLARALIGDARFCEAGDSWHRLGVRGTSGVARVTDRRGPSHGGRGCRGHRVASAGSYRGRLCILRSDVGLA